MAVPPRPPVTEMVPVVAAGGIVTVTEVAVIPVGTAVAPEPLNVTNVTPDILLPVRVMELPVQPLAGIDEMVGIAAIWVSLFVPAQDVPQAALQL